MGISRIIKARKVLEDNSIIAIEKYRLSEKSARALGAGHITEETVITLKSPYISGSTPPRVSWYITQEDINRLYDAITTRDEFMRVTSFLYKEIKSIEDREKLPQLLNQILIKDKDFL